MVSRWCLGLCQASSGGSGTLPWSSACGRYVLSRAKAYTDAMSVVMVVAPFGMSLSLLGAPLSASLPLQYETLGVKTLSF
jgi:hypothetical protein